MQKTRLIELQKKGMKSVNSRIEGLIGLVLVLVIVVALAPTIFTSASDLNTTGAPAWVQPVVLVTLGVVILMIIYRAGTSTK